MLLARHIEIKKCEGMWLVFSNPSSPDVMAVPYLFSRLYSVGYEAVAVALFLLEEELKNCKTF